MAFFDQYSSLLTHISEVLACETIIESDQNGVAMMGLNEGLGVVFYASEEANSVISSVLIGQPDPNNAEYLYDLLCGNYMHSISGGGTIGIDAQSGVLCVHREVNLPVEPSTFEDVLAQLIGAARYWRERLDVQSVELASPAMMRV